MRCHKETAHASGKDAAYGNSSLLNRAEGSAFIISCRQPGGLNIVIDRTGQPPKRRHGIQMIAGDFICCNGDANIAALGGGSLGTGTEGKLAGP